MAKGISDAYLKEAQYVVDTIEKEEDCVHVPGYVSAPEA
jgi:hypothetical protein